MADKRLAQVKVLDSWMTYREEGRPEKPLALFRRSARRSSADAMSCAGFRSSRSRRTIFAP